MGLYESNINKLIPQAEEIADSKHERPDTSHTTNTNQRAEILAPYQKGWSGTFHAEMNKAAKAAGIRNL